MGSQVKFRVKSAMRWGLLVAGGAVLAAPAVGQRPALAMLSQLERGNWEVRERGAGGDVQRICMADGRRLIQLRHPAAACDRIVISDTASSVTVQYTCPGLGYGRTTIRRETNQLVQIDSQGIAGGLPFAFAAEGRRLSDCR